MLAPNLEISREGLISELAKRPDFRFESLKAVMSDGVRSIMETQAFQTEGEDGTWLTCSFASEQPVRRWFGWLSLSCKRGAINMERIEDNGVPFCADHNAYDEDKMLGVVRRVWLRTRVAYMSIQFNNRDHSMLIREEMLSGDRPGVSPLAIPMTEDDIEILEDDGLFDQNVRFNIWTPYEISTVSMAANTKVGAGPGKLSDDSGAYEDSKIEAMLYAARRRYWTMPEGQDVNDSGQPGQPNGGGTGAAVLDPANGQQLQQQQMWSPAQQMLALGWTQGPNGVMIPPGGQMPMNNPAPVNNDGQLSQQIVDLTSKVAGQGDQIQLMLAREQKQSEALEIYRLGFERGFPDLASEHISEGGDAAAFREKLTTITMNPQMRQSRTMPNNRGPQEFSLARLARAKAYPDSVEYQRAAEYELSAGNDISQNAVEGGTMVPFQSYAAGGYKLGNGTPPPIYQIANREERLGREYGGRLGWLCYPHTVGL